MVQECTFMINSLIFMAWIWSKLVKVLHVPENDCVLLPLCRVSR